MTRKITLERDLQSGNARAAAAVRRILAAAGLPCLNLMSSPGAGKTSLLERTLALLRGRLNLGLITGDPYTENDADRLRRAGATRVAGIETGGLCHLEAPMVLRALETMGIDDLDLLIIENVGNLICPAAHDLGETHRVVLLSPTEGESKPLKYPVMFRSAAMLVLNKLDLAGVLECDIEVLIANARAVNPSLEIFPLSCRTGEGFDRWTEKLANLAKIFRRSPITLVEEGEKW